MSPVTISNHQLNHHHHQTRGRDHAGDVGRRGGGGGDERMEMDDDVELDANDDDDNQMDEADTASVRADLVDALAALGVRPAMASKAVSDGVVTSDRDVVACKRYLAASTANSPPAVLWSQYLSAGRLPIIPSLESASTVTEAQKEWARQMLEATDKANAPGDALIDQAAAAALAARVQLLTMGGKQAKVIQPPGDYWRAS